MYPHSTSQNQFGQAPIQNERATPARFELANIGDALFANISEFLFGVLVTLLIHLINNPILFRFVSVHVEVSFYVFFNLS